MNNNLITTFTPYIMIKVRQQTAQIRTHYKTIWNTIFTGYVIYWTTDNHSDNVMERVVYKLHSFDWSIHMLYSLIG